MRTALASTLLASTLMAGVVAAEDAPTKRILIDIAHGQRFWNDPARMEGRDPGDVGRVRYMTEQIEKTARAIGAVIGYLDADVTPEGLAECDALFIHLPTKPYSASEVKAIRDYVNGGGSLFIVMEVDYWTKMADTNVNEIVADFGVAFGERLPGEASGGRSEAGLVTADALKIPYHGGRAVDGGTPFCFSQEEQPFGVFVDVKGGGRVVAMGDGMVSLYMTSWQGVDDYQCAEFMQAAFAWLLD